jgi:hypothetical protein
MNNITKLIKAELALQRWERKLSIALNRVAKLRHSALYHRNKCGFPYLGKTPTNQETTQNGHAPTIEPAARRAPRRLAQNLRAPAVNILHQPSLGTD